MAFPLSTYRLQMRADCFTFADALEVLDYLDDLGVSHLYLSPILTAVEGSTHGYDVTDPTTVSAALGGPEGLARLSAAAQARGMGLIVDIVPNHVGIEHPDQNRWWRDVLEHGRLSPYATYFDIDWDLDPDGRIVLPVLGSDDDDAPPGYPVDDQHYRLIGWRHGICGYRRFFSITSLAGLRQEDRAVFDATHVEVKRWFSEGLVDGLRIDHPDGLSDPAGYLAWLRETRRTGGVDRHREDPCRRRGAGAHAARRGHHRLRRPARDRRALRRPHRARGTGRVVGLGTVATYDRVMPGTMLVGRTAEGDRRSTRCPAS